MTQASLDAAARALKGIKKIHDLIGKPGAMPFYSGKHIGVAAVIAPDDLDAHGGSQFDVAKRYVAQVIEPLVRLRGAVRAKIIDDGRDYRVEHLDLLAERADLFQASGHHLLQKEHAFLNAHRASSHFNWWTGRSAETGR